MNIEFLKKLGINEEDPHIVLNKLGAKEIELLDKKDLAESNGADERVKEIEDLLKQLKVEREVVKEEAKSYVSKGKKDVDKKEDAKAQKEKKNAAYEKLMQKKKAEAEVQAAKEQEVQQRSQGETQTGNASSNFQQTTAHSKTNANNSQKTGQNGTQQAAQQTTQQTTQQSANQNVNTTKANTASAPKNGASEFANGLNYYKHQDYINAFNCFFNVAEEKDVQDQNAEMKRARASYLLAAMFKNGEGTQIDIDKSNHYLKRAADFNYDRAQLDYGELLLSEHISIGKADIKARKEGWRYIEKAADAGLVEAEKKYIDLAKNSSDADEYIFAKARIYIEELRSQLDSYEAKKCDDLLKEVNIAEKTTKKKASYTKKFIFGEILFLIGTIYLFKGLNPTFFEENLSKINRFIPVIPEFLIIKWDKLLAMTEPYMTHQGIFGGWLIVLGNLIRGLGVKEIKLNDDKCRTFRKINRIAIILLCIIHFYANTVETSKFFGNGGYMQVFAMVVSIIIGRILGAIAFRIIK